MVFFTRIWCLFLVLGTVACTPDGARTTTDIFRATSSIAATPQSLHSYLSDTTTKSFSKAHGTQFEYLVANGRSYLVYPENKFVLKGSWTTQSGGFSGTNICFASDGSARNPVTGQVFEAGEWDCRNGSLYLAKMDEIRDGDPLNLRRTDRLPQVLPKGINLSIPTAAKTVGLSTNMALNKAPDPDKSDEKLGL